MALSPVSRGFELIARQFENLHAPVIGVDDPVLTHSISRVQVSLHDQSTAGIEAVESFVEHYADKAALLLDGRIVREWSDSEIAAVRETGRFEEVLAGSH